MADHIALTGFDQIVTLEGAFQKDGRNLEPEDLSVICDASVVIKNQSIEWVGKTSELPKTYSHQKHINGGVLIPELVDSHTHTVFGGDRSKEYKMRMDGATYEQIAKAGGGILSTMNATRNSSEQDLYEKAKQRILNMYKLGVGTIEIKSGYGLSFEMEYQLSKIITRLKQELSPEIQIISTYMAAHAIPSESNEKKYIDEVVIPLMHKLHKEQLIDCVDIFHEVGYFGEESVKKLFTEANTLGLKTKIHADEFQDNNGALVASDQQCLSADHLLAISDKNIKSIAKTDTIATMLPGTGFFLGKKQAPARKILDAGGKLAIASDYNPGSCHFPNLLLIACLASKAYPLNSAELICSLTLNASHALNLKNQGAIQRGMSSRFTYFKDVKSIDEVIYHWGENFAENKLINAEVF